MTDTNISFDIFGFFINSGVQAYERALNKMNWNCEGFGFIFKARKRVHIRIFTRLRNAEDRLKDWKFCSGYLFRVP